MSNRKITSATGNQFSAKSLISLIAITAQSKIASFLLKFALDDLLPVRINDERETAHRMTPEKAVVRVRVFGETAKFL